MTSFEALILFIISTIGMTHIIVDGTIMGWFRDLVKNVANRIKRPVLGGVVDCYLCCGAWCGFLMGFVWISSNPLQIFGCGCAGGFLAHFAAVLLNWMEAATIVNLPSESQK